MQFTLALCFALSTFATAQESAPSTSKKVVAAKITAVVPAGENENSKTATPSASQSLTIDQNAVTIYEKSVAVARALKAIQLTTRMTATGRDSGMMPPEFMEPTSSIWDLEATEGSPCKRMRIESIKNEKPVRVITFDGTHSLLANVPSKTYMEEGTNWSLLLKSAGSGVPQWVLKCMLKRPHLPRSLPQTSSARRQSTDNRAIWFAYCVQSILELPMMVMKNLPR